MLINFSWKISCLHTIHQRLQNREQFSDTSQMAKKLKTVQKTRNVCVVKVKKKKRLNEKYFT